MEDCQSAGRARAVREVCGWVDWCISRLLLTEVHACLLLLFGIMRTFPPSASIIARKLLNLNACHSELFLSCTEQSHEFKFAHALFTSQVNQWFTHYSCVVHVFIFTCGTWFYFPRVISDTIHYSHI